MNSGRSQHSKELLREFLETEYIWQVLYHIIVP